MTKTCQQCNKEFRTYPSQEKRRKFCSVLCTGQSFRGQLRICQQCNKAFKGKRRSRFCSLGCAGFKRRARVAKKCISCKKQFTVHNCRDNEAKFCSHVCYARNKIGYTPWNKGRSDIYSEKTIEKMSNYRKGKKPWNYSRRDRRMQKICPCGVSFFTFLSRPAIYCSVKCRSKYHVVSGETREKSRNAQINRVIKFKDTSIELRVEELLRNLGIEYQKQVPLCRVARVDFFIPNKSLVIQCDGCYWHGCPMHFPNAHKEKKEISKQQDETLRRNGLKVFRFWEHEIMSPNFEIPHALQL